MNKLFIFLSSVFFACGLSAQGTSFPGSVFIPTGANNAYRAGNYVSIGNMSYLNTPYISFNALLTTSDIPTGVNAFTPHWNAGGGLLLMGDAGNSGLHFFQKDYANGTPPYNLNTFTESLTLSHLGNIGMGVPVPIAKLDIQALTTQNGLRIKGEQNAGLSNIYVTTGHLANADRYFFNAVAAGSGSNVQEFYVKHNGDGYFAGNVGIGITSPSQKVHVQGNVHATGKLIAGPFTVAEYTKAANYALAVNGNAIANKIVIKNFPNWPDYVFNSSYRLRTLSSLDTFIKKYNHLPDVPSAKKVKEGDLDIGETQATLLKKIEELTLYMIELDKQQTLEKKSLEKLNVKIDEQQKIIEAQLKLLDVRQQVLLQLKEQLSK